MTDPAPVLRREVDAITETHITTLKQARSPSGMGTSGNWRAKIHALFKAKDLSNPWPGEAVRKRNVAHPHPSV
jgi:hypothetical protein